MKRIVAPVFALFLSVFPVLAQETFDTNFQAAERAKARLDYAGMEIALKRALQFGPGDEYIWRSLAWAQGRQGKWRESLSNARENLRRHGEHGWPLRQLFESAMVAGDLDLARDSLARANRLPIARRDNLTFDENWKELERLTASSRYRLTFVISDKPGTTPLRYLIPALKAPRQTTQIRVDEVRSWRTLQEGRDWILEIQPLPDRPFRITIAAELQPSCLGSSRLEKVPPGTAPPALAAYLGPMHNKSRLDPSEPACQALARTLKGNSGAETVQNILDWLRQNMICAPPYGPDTPSEIIRNRHGLCHHHSNLMASLCRAAGVPAVIAHGIKLPDEKGEVGIGHGWVEVYLNGIGWVPVEPMNPNSLRSFGGGTYLFLHSTGHTPEENHFTRRYRTLQDYPGQAERLH